MTGTALFILRMLIAAALFAFLVSALWMLWHELRRESALALLRKAPALILQSEGAKTYRFIKPEVVIGRDPSHDIALSDKTVSTQHARFSYHHKQWWLEDLDSTNGTFLNQEQVSSPVVVASGDHIRCGQVQFTLLIEDLDESD
jgi:hypothetical protein